MYRCVMILGVFATLAAGLKVVRLLMGLDHLENAEFMPGIVGGFAGGISAYYFVPWLMRREAERKRGAAR